MNIADTRFHVSPHGIRFDTLIAPDNNFGYPFPFKYGSTQRLAQFINGTKKVLDTSAFGNNGLGLLAGPHLYHAGIQRIAATDLGEATPDNKIGEHLSSHFPDLVITGYRLPV